VSKQEETTARTRIDSVLLSGSIIGPRRGSEIILYYNTRDNTKAVQWTYGGRRVGGLTRPFISENNWHFWKSKPLLHNTTPNCRHSPRWHAGAGCRGRIVARNLRGRIINTLSYRVILYYIILYYGFTQCRRWQRGCSYGLCTIYTCTRTHTPRDDTRTRINIEYFNPNRRDERSYYYFINVRAHCLPANTRHYMYGRPCLWNTLQRQ